MLVALSRPLSYNSYLVLARHTLLLVAGSISAVNAASAGALPSVRPHAPTDWPAALRNIQEARQRELQDDHGLGLAVANASGWLAYLNGVYGGATLQRPSLYRSQGFASSGFRPAGSQGSFSVPRQLWPASATISRPGRDRAATSIRFPFMLSHLEFFYVRRTASRAGARPRDSLPRHFYDSEDPRHRVSK